MDHNRQTELAMERFEKLNGSRIKAVKSVLCTEMNVRRQDHRVIKLAEKIVKAINRHDP